jgi:hypothetical protein
MTTQELLAQMRLLSGLESFCLSSKERMPDYLLERLCDCVEVLERELLKRTKEHQ